MRCREKPLQEATSANAQRLLELEQLGLLETYKNFEQSFKWLRDLNINGYNFQIDQPSVNWKEIFDGEWLEQLVISIFGWPWYVLIKFAIIYAMLIMILFITNLIIKFYNAFAIHKAIGEKAIKTKILLTGIFGFFSQTLTQLIAQIQEDETHYSDDINTFQGNNNSKKFIQKFRRHSTDSPHITDHNDNNKPTEVYVDTNYKHYNTTIRRTGKGLQLRTLETSPEKRKPPLPERKYRHEPFRIEPFKIEPLETKSENNKMSNTIPPLPPQLITPPPAYQCLGTQSTLPSAPQLQQHTTQFNIGTQPYENPKTLQKQSTPYEYYTTQY